MADSTSNNIKDEAIQNKTTEESPSLVDRVSGIPVVQTASDNASYYYNQVKESNEYVRQGLETLEDGVAKAATYASPYTDSLKQKAEEYGLNAKGQALLDNVQTRYPVINESTETLIGTGQEAINQKIEKANQVYNDTVAAMKSQLPGIYDPNSETTLRDALYNSAAGKASQISEQSKQYLYHSADSTTKYMTNLREKFVKEEDIAKYSQYLEEQNQRLQASVASTQAYITNTATSAQESIKDLKEKRFQQVFSTAKELQTSLQTTVSTLVEKANFTLSPKLQETVNVLSARLNNFIENLRENGDQLTAAKTLAVIGAEANNVWSQLKVSFKRHMHGSDEAS